MRSIADRVIGPTTVRRSHARIPGLRALLQGPTARRLALIGLTAMLLVMLVLLATGNAPPPPARADTFRAVLIRPSGDGGAEAYQWPAMDIVLADADGHEHVVRRITARDLAHDAPAIQLGGTVSEDGWLFLWPSGRIAQPDIGAGFVTVLFDLKDPARPPMLIPSNGAMGPRFGPDGLVAIPCGAAPRCDSPGSRQVRVMDLDQPDAPARLVNGVPFLGGGPEMIWAADGSGFLARTKDPGVDWYTGVGGRPDHDSWGIKPLDGGPIQPGFPPIIHRRFSADLGFDLDTTAGWLRVKRPTRDVMLETPGDLPGMPLTALLSNHADGIWVLLRVGSGDATELVLDRIGEDGSVTEMRRIVRHGDDDPWLELSPDDSLAAFRVDAEGADFRTTLLRVDEAASDSPPSTLDGLLVGWVTQDAAERITQATAR